MNTIRERIITAILTAAADVLEAKGYNTSMGSHVFRAVKTFNADPAMVVFPGVESRTRINGVSLNVMPVRLEGFVGRGSADHQAVSEQILGDLIEFMTAPDFTMAFTSGGTTEIEVGDVVTGHTSSATAYVCSVTVSSGTWAGGNAAGSLMFRRKSGTFVAENLDIGTSLNVATITGVLTIEDAIGRVTNDLAMDIEYTEGGQSEFPDGSADMSGAYAMFNILYDTKYGNPYGQ